MMFSSSGQKEGTYRRILGTDRSVLLIAMLIAALAWGISRLSMEYTYTTRINVKYLLAEDLAFSQIPPSKIELQINGTGWSLIRFLWSSALDSAEIILDERMERVNTGQAVRNILSKEGFDQLEVVATYPFELSLTLSEKIRKKVPVRLVGGPGTSVHFTQRGKIQLKPDSVLISGPRELIAPFEYWPTDTLDLQPLNRSIELTVSLQRSPNPQITISPGSVQLIINVEPVSEKQLYIPIEVPDSLKGRVKIFPEEALVTVTAGISRYDELDPALFSLIAETGLDSTTNVCAVTMRRQPSFAQTIQFFPEEVELFILN